MYNRYLVLSITMILVVGSLFLMKGSVASPLDLANPLILVSNQGQAGADVDKTLVQNTVIDPAPNWRTRFFDAAGWQDAYPVKRALAWTTSAEIAPLLNDGADHVWGGAPGGPLEPDAGNGTAYPNRESGGHYDNGHPIPASPSPQYLFLRRDFCLPINAQANAQRRLTNGDIEIHLLNATDSAGIPDGAASVYLNGDIIAWIPGDESGAVELINVPDPRFLYRGRNALTMRVGDARSDARAAILYRAAIDYAIDPDAIALHITPDSPFVGEPVDFSVATDGLSGRSPYIYQWAFGDGDAGAGANVDHVYEMTGSYTVSLTIADVDACTATAALPLTVLPHPLSIEKTAYPDPVTAGETLRYRLTVENRSAARSLTNVVVTDTLPPGTTFNFCSGGCAPPIPPDRTVAWTLGSLGPGQSTTLDLYVDVDLTVSGVLTNATYGARATEAVTTGQPMTVTVQPPPCPAPLEAVALSGPTQGYTATTYVFTGTLTPTDPTTPLALAWAPEPITGQGTLSAAYQWPAVGTYPITLTAENCGGMISATRAITISAPPPTCPAPLTDVNIIGPSAGETDTPLTFTAALTPTDATPPLTTTWAPAPLAGQGTLTATYQWDAPGAYTITLRAENCGGTSGGGGIVSATRAITVSAPPPTCPAPLADVDIVGPSAGETDTPLTFTAALTPTDATPPLTTTWAPAPLAGQGTLTATYQWDAPGAYTITLRAENCGGISGGGGIVSATRAIAISAPPPTCPVPLTGVAIAGPSAGETDTPLTFTAALTPTDATPPLTFTWTPAPLSGQNSATATYRWPDPGVHPVTLHAENCGGAITATREVILSDRPIANIYLPLVIRNWPDDAPDRCPGWLIEPGAAHRENFDHYDDRDWFVFQATAGLSYTLRTDDLEIYADTVITLYDSACTTPLAYNDDIAYPNDLASEIKWPAQTTGPLHLEVRNFAPHQYGEQTGYTLLLYRESAPPDEEAPGACPGQMIDIGTRYPESFDHPNDNDWFTFEATAGQTYTIATDDLGPRADTLLELWGDDCATKLDENDDIDPGVNVASRIVWQAQTSGRLSVMVRSYDWTVYGEGTEYTLTVYLKEE
ncbi:MAG: PKD domain-containing protein [Anaerolineales bacterium]